MPEDKQLLFSLSKAKGDFVVQPFKGSGKGGQKRNKTMSCCRITHPKSGAVAECQEERSFEQNRKRAFRRLLEKPEFVLWHKLEVAKALGEMDLDKVVERELQNVKVEVLIDGKWVDEKEAHDER